MNKVVYKHRRNDNNSVFYIGMGNEQRPYEWYNRTKEWFEVVAECGYRVEIVAKKLSEDDAHHLKGLLIYEYGLKNLTNILPGRGYESNEPSSYLRIKR